MKPVTVPSESRTVLSIVVPCFNESAVLRETYARLSTLRTRLVEGGKISHRSELVFVDDGSRDDTWRIIHSWTRTGAPVVGIKLSRNCGHQSALLAGISAARGDAVVSIDADLQDDEAAIERMVDAFHEGNEVVYGVRAGRDSDTWFKRFSARGFYRLMAALGVETVFDHADYRLLSQRAVAYLLQFDEVNLFLRGVMPLLGLRSTVVRYDRRLRFAGESKYPLRKMLEFALNGITSFSIAPLRAITFVGLAVSFFCLLLTVWAFSLKFVSDSLVPGWTSTILPIYFLGGVQLLGVGVLGEYVGKIYMEIKRRPRFLIEERAESHRVGAVDAARKTHLLSDQHRTAASDAALAAVPTLRGARGRSARMLLTPPDLAAVAVARSPDAPSLPPRTMKARA